MAVKYTNTRIQVTLSKVDKERLIENAKRYGISASQYVDMVLRSAGAYDART